MLRNRQPVENFSTDHPVCVCVVSCLVSVLFGFLASSFLSCPISFMFCLAPALYGLSGFAASCYVWFLPFPCPVLSGSCLACFLCCPFAFSCFLFRRFTVSFGPYLLCFRSGMLLELYISYCVCSLFCLAPVVPGSGLACFLSRPGPVLRSSRGWF